MNYKIAPTLWCSWPPSSSGDIAGFETVFLSVLYIESYFFSLYYCYIEIVAGLMLLTVTLVLLFFILQLNLFYYAKGSLSVFLMCFFFMNDDSFMGDNSN